MKEEKLRDCHALFLKTVVLIFSIKQQLLFKIGSKKRHLKLNTEASDNFPPQLYHPFKSFFPRLHNTELF